MSVAVEMVPAVADFQDTGNRKDERHQQRYVDQRSESRRSRDANNQRCNRQDEESKSPIEHDGSLPCL